MTRGQRMFVTSSALSMSLLASSCATLVPTAVYVEAERLLPMNALAYARLDRATFTQALVLVAGEGQKGAAMIAERTDSLTAAIVRPAGSPSMDLLAVAEGRYPAGTASARLASDPAWKRSGPVWEKKDGSMHLAFANDGRAFFGTGPIDGLVAAAKAPNQNPIPARWAAAWSLPVAIYIPKPIALLSGRVPMGDGAVPMLAMLISAKPGPGDTYEATLYFEFESERAALIFSPLCRVFLYAVARTMWPDRSATVLDGAVWTINGSTVTASRLPLDAPSLAAFLGGTGSFD
jgi:hypothetical protein